MNFQFISAFCLTIIHIFKQRQYYLFNMAQVNFYSPLIQKMTF